MQQVQTVSAFAPTPIPPPALPPEAPPEPLTDQFPPREKLWPAMGLWRHMLVALLLAVIVGASFSNSYKSGMVLDNRYIIEEYYKSLINSDPRFDLRSWNEIKNIFSNDYWWPKGISGLYRPITTLSYWLDYVVLNPKGPKADTLGLPSIHTLNGLEMTPQRWSEMSWQNYVNAPGLLPTDSYHTTNLIVHWINSLLVYLIALFVLKRWWPAFLVAGLFAAHPITTESVTNIIGRADMFAAVAVFGGLLLYMRSSQEMDSKALPWLVLLLLITAFGVFSKESAAALGFVLVVFDVSYRWRSDNPRLRGLLPLLAHLAGYLTLAAVLIGLPLWVGWLSLFHEQLAGDPMKMLRIVIAIAGPVVACGIYALTFFTIRPIRIAGLRFAAVAVSIGCIAIPYWPLIASAAILIAECIRGSITSAQTRFRVIGHSVLYLALFLIIIAIPFGVLWFFNQHHLNGTSYQDPKAVFPPYALNVWIRYILATASFAGGLTAHFALVRNRSPMIRAASLAMVILAMCLCSLYTLWMGVLLGVIVALHELILGSFVPRDMQYRRDWKLIWNGFALGYVAMIPPLLAMFITRQWVFVNSTPAEEPFLDNPIRGIWQIADLHLPSFARELAAKPLLGLSYLECKMTAVKVMGKLLYLLAWPRTLCSDYSYSQVPNFSWTFGNGFEDVKAIIALLAMLIIFVVVPIFAYRRNRGLFFFILFFFAAALPTSNFIITIGSIMAERFMYLPLAGFTGVVVIGVYWGLQRLADLSGIYKEESVPWPKMAASAGLAIVIGVYGIRAYFRNSAWISDLTLWTDAMQTSPMSFRSHQSLAFAVFEQYNDLVAHGRPPAKTNPLIDRMIAIAEGGLPICNPLPLQLNSSRLYLHLGMYYELKAQIEYPSPNIQSPLAPEARVLYQKAVDVLEYGSKVDRAFDEVNLTRQRLRNDAPDKITDAGLAQIYILLGSAYVQLGQYDLAIGRLQYGRHLDPMDPATYRKISDAYLLQNRVEQAIISRLEILLLPPFDHPDVWQELIRLYSGIGDPGKGAFVQQGPGHIALNANQPLVRSHLLTAYRELIRTFLRSKRDDLANFERRRALTTFPQEHLEDLFNEPLLPVTPDGVGFDPAR